jgi:hypothetical protein
MMTGTLIEINLVTCASAARRNLAAARYAALQKLPLEMGAVLRDSGASYED